MRFTALLHHAYDVDHLRKAYLALKRDASAGVDGETWRHYGEALEVNGEWWRFWALAPVSTDSKFPRWLAPAGTGARKRSLFAP